MSEFLPPLCAMRYSPSSLRPRSLAVVLFSLSLALVLYELVLTRVFAIVMFAQFAHLAISLALLGVAVGALALHLFPRLLPEQEDRFAARLGWLSVAMALGMVLAVWATVSLPLTRITDDINDRMVVGFLARQRVMSDLVDTRVVAALVPLLAFPFACAGVAFAGVFRRARESIGLLYAADLSGGAVGCVLFLPLLAVLRGPDAVVVCALVAGLAAWVAFRGTGRRAPGLVAAALVGAGLAAVVVGRSVPLLAIRYAAGFDERGVVEDVWTPLARLAVFENAERAYIMLDNTSRSEVILTEQRHAQYEREPYSIVFDFVRPPARIAVLAAGAGPDIITAVKAGHHDITAIELAPEYFEIMRRRFKRIPLNPYLVRGVRTIGSDARSAVMHDPHSFDLIEMSQINFYSFGGMIAQAWQAGLLVTKEAFSSYLDHLTRDGMVAIYGSTAVSLWGRNAAAALHDRGVREPWRQIAIIAGRGQKTAVLLVKRRPFTAEEMSRLEPLVAGNGAHLTLHPLRPSARWKKAFAPGLRVQTDDRPYWDDWKGLGTAWRGLFRGKKSTVAPAELLQRLLLVQLGMLFAAGVLLIGVPLLWRGRREIATTAGAAPVLGYFAAIGYGYLAVEIVLLHKLVLFVGHPTYAITLVLFTLLVSSGLGSLFAGRIGAERVGRTLVIALACVLVLAGLHAFVLSPILTRHLLGLSLVARNVIVGLTLLPLGFAMGMSFPLALRRLPAEEVRLVPWCWAINGWMSVVAAVVTVFVARLEGYETAFVLALAAYALAIPLSTRLSPRGSAPADSPSRS